MCKCFAAGVIDDEAFVSFTFIAAFFLAFESADPVQHCCQGMQPAQRIVEVDPLGELAVGHQLGHGAVHQGPQASNRIYRAARAEGLGKGLAPGSPASGVAMAVKVVHGDAVAGANFID